MLIAGGPSQNHRKEGSEEFKIFFPSLYLDYRMGIQTPQFVRNKSRILGRSRVVGTLVDVSQNFWKLVDAFSPKRVFYRNLRDVSTNNTQKINFIAFSLTNFPKISKKVLKNFSRRLRRRKKHIFGAFGAENV